LEDERIVNQDRLEIIRRVEDPIRFGRQSERGELFIVVEVIAEFSGGNSSTH